MIYAFYPYYTVEELYVLLIFNDGGDNVTLKNPAFTENVKRREAI